MRLCRFETDGKAQAGFYFDKHIVPVEAAAKAVQGKTDRKLALGEGDDLLAYLPHSKQHADAKFVAEWLGEHSAFAEKLAVAKPVLRTPIPPPNKLFLLAGQRHIWAEVPTVCHVRLGPGPIRRILKLFVD